jgi:hypothetical protein
MEPGRQDKDGLFQDLESDHAAEGPEDLAAKMGGPYPIRLVNWFMSK